MQQRPFEGNSENSLGQQIQAANPKFPVTQPPVSLGCLYAIGAALNPNPAARMGATWESFIHNEFFKIYDFEKLERKFIEPVFVPSSDKTNFDATYDLEELLLEEAPLEARARRQKPRERLKDDATEKEIREDGLYRMIETDFRPFDYTIAAYKKSVLGSSPPRAHDTNHHRITEASESLVVPENQQPDPSQMGPQAITTDEATPLPAGGNQQPVSVSSTIDQHSNSDARSTPPRPSSGSAAYRSEYVSRTSRSAGKRITSPSGGVQVTLDGGGSWSELARQDATLPTDANAAQEGKGEGSGGMFGFLKSKKGRNNSPRPKERGVLGKEGARVVIG